MNFDYIENLVRRCKNNDETAKEKLTDEFKPLIYNISKKTFVMDIAFMIFSRNVINHFLNLFPCTIWKSIGSLLMLLTQ